MLFHSISAVNLIGTIYRKTIVILEQFCFDKLSKFSKDSTTFQLKFSDACTLNLEQYTTEKCIILFVCLYKTDPMLKKTR